MKGKSIILLVVMAVIAVVLSFTARFGVGETKALSIENIKMGLDLSGGVSIVYQAEKEGVTDEDMASAVSLIQRRLDRKGYTEGESSRQGENRIRVEIPGVEDAEKAVAELGQTAQLLFVNEAGETLLTGAHVKSAQKSVGQTSQNGPSQAYVSLEFTEEGKGLFAQATQDNIGKPLFIVMDGEIVSAPIVNSAITSGESVITGNFTPEEAETLAVSIREGSLPFNLSVMEMSNVGARLGVNAMETSMTAAVIGIALVLIFMIVAYRISGLAANWALIIYIGLEIIALSLFGVTLTLSGIAGIILSIGMAVDANVIIFERIKEEIKGGKTVRTAVDAGFSRALPAIIDGNITTFIAGAVLFFMGTGTIRGFAETLMIGIVISMFTAIVVTRLILKGFIGVGLDNPAHFGIKVIQTEVKEG